MNPSVFEVLSADSQILANFGDTPVRIWPFGSAPETPATPYAVWQIVAGEPLNLLTNPPTLDRFLIQFDLFAEGPLALHEAGKAIRDAVERVAVIVSWREQIRETETRLYRLSFDAEWHSLREENT